jgi:hypothetical protein
MVRNRLSPKDITENLSHYRGALVRRWTPVTAVTDRRSKKKRYGKTQSLCDRVALWSLVGFGCLQIVAIFLFDLL